MSGVRRVFLALILPLLGILFSCLHATPASASTGINSQISFEGKVVAANGTNVADGTYNMEFKIYQDGTGTGGGTQKWQEDYRIGGTGGVTVTNGTFVVNLGSICGGFAAGTCDGHSNAGVDFDQSVLYLSMQLGNTSSCTITTTFLSNCGGDGEMSPYIRFTSTPYAQNAGAVGGLTASQLVQLTPGSQQSGSINVLGNIQTGGTLQASSIDTPASGVLTVGSTANTTGITLNQNTTITSGKTLTVGGQAVFSGTGILQAAALSNSVLYSNITQIGTVTAGTWNATAIGAGYGGTGQSTYAAGDLLYAASANPTSLSKLTIGGTGTCLTVSGGLPTWGSCANTALSNLASTAVNVSIVPGSSFNNLIDIGSGSFGFRSGYFNTSLVSPLLQSASAALALDTAAGGTVSVGSTNATTINVGAISGSTAQSLDIGNGGGNNAINIGTGAGTDTISIGGSGDSTTIRGGINSETFSATGEILQSTTNSTTAFQIQNANGLPIFLVDTSTSLSGNYVTDGGFEAGTTTPTGWSAIGAPTTFVRNTTAPNHYGGLASLQLVTTATAANQGATTSTFNSAPAAGTYTVSFYAEQTSGTVLASSTLQAVVNGVATACSAGVTLSTSGFQRVTCPVTPAGTVTSLGIQVPSASAAVRTIYIDAVQLVTGSSATAASSAGTIQLRGAVDAPAVFQALSNSTTALQVTDSTGLVDMLTVDTLNKVVLIGSATPNTNAIFLGLNNYSTTADPTAVANGEMYYNSSTNSFRCRLNGAWQSCGPQSAVVASDVTMTSKTAAVNVTGLTFGVTANTKYELSCNLIYQSSATTGAVGFGLNGPATPTAVVGQITQYASVGAVTPTFIGFNAYGTTNGAAIAAAATSYPAHMEATFSNGATAGTLALQFISSSNTITATVKAGSSCSLTQL